MHLDKGHHLIQTPDGQIDDFNLLLPDYVVKHLLHRDTECYEQGEVLVEGVQGDGDTIQTTYQLLDFLYEDGTEVNTTVKTTGVLVEENGKTLYKVNLVELQGLENLEHNSPELQR